MISFTDSPLFFFSLFSGSVHKVVGYAHWLCVWGCSVADVIRHCRYLESPTVGVFRFVYSASEPGKYELRIKAFDSHIGEGTQKSPFTVEVRHGNKGGDIACWVSIAVIGLRGV